MAESAENRAALAALDLAEDAAALVSLNHFQALDAAGTLHSSTRMTRKWAKISDKNREALEAALKAREYETDPMADQETRTGRWKVLRVYSSPEKTDPRQQGIYEVLQYWPVGYDGSFGTYCAESSVLHHEDVETFLDAPAPVTCGHAITPGTIYTAANDLDPETGLWRGRLGEDVARTPAKIAWATGGVLETTARERQINAAAAPTIAASAAAGTLIAGSIDLNRYGYFDWDKQTETAVKPAAVVWTDGGPLATAAHTEQMNDSAAPTIGAGSAGTNTSARINLNRYGWFDWSQTVETAVKPAAITWADGGPIFSTAHERQINDTAAPTIAAGTAGTNTSGRIDLNRFGRFDWDKQTETAAKPAAITWATGGVLETTARTRQLNDTAAPNLVAATAGTFNTGTIDLNRFGRFDWDSSVETAVKPAAVEWTDGGPLASAAHTDQLNDTSVPTIGAGVAGRNTSARVNLNRFGRFDWNKVVESAVKPAAVEWTDGGPIESSAHTEQTNDTTVPTVGAGAAGTNTSARVNLNRFGQFDWSKTVETASKPAATEWTDGGPLASAAHTDQLNDTAVPSIGAGAAGTNTSGRVNLNRFGRFDWNKIVETAVKPSAITWTDGGPLVSTAHERQLNDTAKPTVAAGAAGSNTSASVDLNRYGRFDWTTATETAVAASQTWQETSKFEITDGITFENQTAVPAYPSATGGGTPIQNITVGINRFGRFDGQASVTSATAGFSVGPVTTRLDAEGSVVETTYYNQAATPVPGPGATEAISNGVKNTTYDPTLNKFGLWTYVKRETSYFSPLGALTTVVDYRLPGRTYRATDTWAEDADTGETLVAFKQMQEIEHHYLKVFASYAEAAAYINLDDAAGAQENRSGSGVREIGNGLYMAHKVVNTTDDAE